jgi:hypothetical protein
LQVGCGGAALDFLASVAKFPQPDDKIRSTELKVSLMKQTSSLFNKTNQNVSDLNNLLVGNGDNLLMNEPPA